MYVVTEMMDADELRQNNGQLKTEPAAAIGFTVHAVRRNRDAMKPNAGPRKTLRFFNETPGQ